jgi:hypothetical protein
VDISLASVVDNNATDIASKVLPQHYKFFSAQKLSPDHFFDVVNDVLTPAIVAQNGLITDVGQESARTRGHVSISHGSLQRR